MRGRILLAVAWCVALCAPAAAIVGGAREAGAIAGHLAMIVGARGQTGTLCTGAWLARDLVLTSAHCVAAPARYQVLASNGASAFSIHAIALHPRYDAKHYARGRVTADVALIKLARPAPAAIPAKLFAGPLTVAAGDRLLVAGFGMSAPDNDASVGVAHAATLAVTGQPGNLQIRLVDPATRGERLGLGACIGDSGAPVFRASGALAVIGVVSWSTGPAGGEGCGGLTGVTPLALYRAWIMQQAAALGSPLKP